MGLLHHEAAVRTPPGSQQRSSTPSKQFTEIEGRHFHSFCIRLLGLFLPNIACSSLLDWVLNPRSSPPRQLATPTACWSPNMIDHVRDSGPATLDDPRRSGRGRREDRSQDDQGPVARMVLQGSLCFIGQGLPARHAHTRRRPFGFCPLVPRRHYKIP